MNIKIRILGKVGILNHLNKTTDFAHNISDILKWTIIEKRNVVSVTYLLKNGKKGSTFISLKGLKRSEIERMVERSREVTEEKLAEYETNLEHGTCNCEAHQQGFYEINGVHMCKHLLAQARLNTSIREIGKLADYIKGA
ncbi:MAG: hypothetical protein F6K34_01440 [Okeania sp. SIO4D6]|nr:hypothetical protein [Okeania sp. SIO4D6]